MDEKTVDIQTSCKDCLFALTAYGEQSDCSQKRLSKFKKKSLAIKQPDGFYMIKAICNTFCKDPILLPQINRIIRIKCDLLLYSFEKEYNDTKAIIKTVKSALQYEEKPNRIVIVVKNKTIKFTELISELKSVCGEVPFKLVRIIDNIPLEEALNRAYPSLESTYYTVLEAGQTPEEEYIKRLNVALNDELLRFVMITGSHNVYHTKLHKAFYGHGSEMSLEQKISEANEYQLQQGLIQESMIYTWDQIKSLS
jgi:hypothetical protein